MNNFYVNCCDVLWCNKDEYENHKKNPRNKHEAHFTQPENHYCCEKCNFLTLNRCDIVRHLNTTKHLLNIKSEKRKYKCPKCDKNYDKYKSYYSHKKLCLPKENIIIEKVEPQNQNEIMSQILELMKETNESKKENDEFKNSVIEKQQQLLEKMMETQHNILTTQRNTTTNNTNNNTQNNQFNINVFLNEKCKDAMNLSDFIENLEVTNEHLYNNAQNGFVKGITQIFMDAIHNQTTFTRPIHCTDSKRETIFIKEENEWKKEESDKKLRSAIQEVSRKGLLQFCQWKDDNPNYVDLDSELGQTYIAIHQNSMAGSKRDEYYPKIIKAIAKQIILDKSECI
jgi:hypothetical protein